LVTLLFSGIIGIAVLIVSPAPLARTADILAERPVRSFLYGLLGQFGLIPILVLLCIALFLILLGILLIPFAIAAYFLAVFGFCALGLLAASLVAGRALT